MKELDKTKVYYLKELTSEERKEISEVTKNPYVAKDCALTQYLIYTNKISHWQVIETYNKPTTNAKELFYTLENVQVDCKELTKEQIKEMADVFVANGYKVDEKRTNVSTHTFTFLRIDGRDVWCSNEDENKTTITYEKFMELFAPQYEVKMIAEQPKVNLESNPVTGNIFSGLIDTANHAKDLAEMANHLKAYKETSNKLNYELDFNFITQMAERMAQNKHKYDPYNWQKLDNIEDLKQALLRHVLDVLKGNYEDEGREFAHLESIALNAMFINYQLNKNGKI